MKAYIRIEDGITETVSYEAGKAEINHAQMTGRRQVRTMSSISRTDYAIEYKDGRSVTIKLTDLVEQPAEQPATSEPERAIIGYGDSVDDPMFGRVVYVKGKPYVLDTVVRQRRYVPEHVTGGYTYAARTVPGRVDYWSVRDGKWFGATRSALDTAKPGTVGAALWAAANEPK